MSRSSAKAHPAARVVCTFIVVLMALVLTALSMAVDYSDNVGPVPTPSAIEIAAPSQVPVHAGRGIFAPPRSSDATRRYHPQMEPSDSSGALGFSMLISLCALLLGGALAPALLHRLRRHP